MPSKKLTNRRLSQRRLSQLPGGTTDDLSLDSGYVQAKLAAKKDMIRLLEAKVRRLEDVLRTGGTWQEYQDTERKRGRERQEQHRAGQKAADVDK